MSENKSSEEERVTRHPIENINVIKQFIADQMRQRPTPIRDGIRERFTTFLGTLATKLPQQNTQNPRPQQRQPQNPQPQQSIKTIRCRQCGFELPEGTKFCPECGHALTEKAKEVQLETRGQYLSVEHDRS